MDAEDLDLIGENNPDFEPRKSTQVSVKNSYMVTTTKSLNSPTSKD